MTPIATETLARIAALYRIEAEIRGKDAAHRLVVRQAKSRPLVAHLRTWFQAQVAKLPARGPTAQAIGYALNHWDGLERFLEDGRIELDSNTVERAMRPVAMRVSLCSTFASICKHWKRVGVHRATRASLSGDRTFDWFGRQIVSTDLVWRSGNNLFSGKNAGFDKPPYGVVCHT